jgi:hypothetical protein
MSRRAIEARAGPLTAALDGAVVRRRDMISAGHMHLCAKTPAASSTILLPRGLDPSPDGSNNSPGGPVF